jgi:uracil-DNA glycosylase
MHPSWTARLSDELDRPYFKTLLEHVRDDRAKHQVLPRRGQVFAAFDATPYEAVRVLLLGQDPYPTPGHAHGLCFSVLPHVQPLPPSLVNLFKELVTDTGCSRPATGCLIPWAERGVLLLNTVLTVRAGAAGSHRNLGWEQFTDRVIQLVNTREQRVVFMLWGADARRKKSLVDETRHTIVEAAHPSPLSAHNGFFGSRPFTRANLALKAAGLDPIDWSL